VYAATYVGLVFVARTWWQALPLSVLLGFVMALIGMNVQHDGGHGAVSDRAGRNRWAARTLELVGGSSYFWHWKHGVLHHTWTNVDHHDTDMDVGVLGRMTPHQPRRWFHRWQQYYLWPLYGLLVIKWHLFDDFREIVVGRMGSHRVPRPRGAEAVLFVAGKVVFLGLAFAVPLQFHSWPAVLACYAVAAGVAGIVLSVVFQLAHIVEDAAFPVPAAGTGRLPDEWAVHQIRTTVDFARTSRVTTWMLGGLNFQVEHHLFPRICHVHYPRISPLVEATCREFGVPFHEHASFGAGVASHFRWLKRMGAPEPSGAPAA
jgi:linoleoyl-CoA desaturase